MSHRGKYIGNTPFLRWRKNISRCHLGGGSMKQRGEKKGEIVKEKGRKGKENGRKGKEKKMVSKRVK